jgi:hypothetical protein
VREKQSNNNTYMFNNNSQRARHLQPSGCPNPLTWDLDYWRRTVMHNRSNASMAGK